MNQCVRNLLRKSIKALSEIPDLVETELEDARKIAEREQMLIDGEASDEATRRDNTPDAFFMSHRYDVLCDNADDLADASMEMNTLIDELNEETVNVESVKDTVSEIIAIVNKAINRN